MTLLDENTFVNKKGQIKVEVKNDMIYVYFSTDYTNPKEVYNANEIGKAKKFINEYAYLNVDDKRELEILFVGLSLSEKEGEVYEEVDQILMRYAKDFELFHDTKKQSYAKIPFEDHNEIYAIRSEEFSDILRKRYLDEYHSVVKNQELDNVIQTISALAKFNGKEYKLHVRLCKYEGAIWFDLGNWKAVKITESGWTIENNPPILFKHFSNQKAYDFEIKKDGNIKDIFKLIRLKHDNQQLLYVVDLCSKFIPDIQHVAIAVSGDAGSGKSTKCQVQKRLVDWCENDFIRMSKNLEELIQNMSHTYYAVFDNLSYLTGDQSDLLATAVTGTSGARRVLYEQDMDFIYNFKICIGMTGIIVVVSRPDLIERSINFEEGKSEEYMSETEFWNLFDELKGSILGGIFDTLVTTMKNKNKINIKRDCRMVDFLEWGSAISVAIGYTQEEFIDAYAISCSKLNDNLLENNVVGRIIIKFMETKSEWEGNMEKLLNELKMIGALLGFEKGSGFPNSPIVLSKKYNELKNNLEKHGIFKIETNKSERIFKLINKKFKQSNSRSLFDNEFKIPNFKEKELPRWTCFSKDGIPNGGHCSDCSSHIEMLEYLKANGYDKEGNKKEDKPKEIKIIQPCSRCGKETLNKQHNLIEEEIICLECEPIQEIPHEIEQTGDEIDDEEYEQYLKQEEIEAEEAEKWEHEVNIPNEVF